MKTPEQPRISRRALLRRGAVAAGLGLAGLAWLRSCETGNAPEQVSWSQLRNNQAAYVGHRIQIVTYGVVVRVDNNVSSDTDFFQGTLQNTSQTDVTSIVEMYNSREEALATRNPNTQPGSLPFLIAVDSEKAPAAIPYIRPNTTPTMKVDPNSAAIALYQLTGIWTKNTGQIVFSPQTIPYFLPVEQAAILEKIS
ncbi:MAG: hypothetical protein ACJ8CB_31845 [Ktedonobacteraceae bacterium]